MNWKNNIRHILIWSFIAIYLVLTLSFTTKQRTKNVCTEIKIAIKDSNINRFIERKDVIQWLEKNEVKVLGYPVFNINTNLIEKIVTESPPIKKVEAYNKINGVLAIDIIQRRPLLRVIDEIGRSFYVDEDAKIMTLSSKFTSHVLVAHGNINTLYPVRNDISVLLDTLDKSGRNIVLELFYMATYINNDDFLKSQIEQIYVSADKEYEMIPRVGRHVIYFGNKENYEYKFKKLKAIYLYGFNNIGWNQYKSVSLKYSNQVICTKH
jgi:cell division protein FtsQ